jgi:hypothetical protein
MMQSLVASLSQIGMTYQDYVREVERYAGLDSSTGANDTERDQISLGPLNLQRMNRNGKSFAPSPETIELMQGIRILQRWMVLSEPWCGDSTQSVAIIDRIAGLSANVDLRFLLRDRFPEIMNGFLTHGARSIPKLVAFTMEGEILFEWGPRPAAAMEVVAQAKAEGVAKQVREERLHLWFAKDRGVQVESEIRALVEREIRPVRPAGVPA